MSEGITAERSQHRLLCCFMVAMLYSCVGSGALALCAGDCNGDRQVTVDELIVGINISLGTAEAGGCSAVDTNQDGEVTVDELVGAVRNALGGCPADNVAFVIATDFQTGSFGTVSVEERAVLLPTGPQRRVNGDAAVRSASGRVYAINRFLADNIQALDPAEDFETAWQCSTGAGSNPHDIALVAADKAYVTLYDLTELLIVDPSAGPDCEGFVRGSIDLSDFADEDGIPEMDQMAIFGDRLYVSLQRVDRNNFFSPAGRAGVVVIDIATDAVLGEITLTGENPFAATKGLPVAGSALVIAQTGSFGALDGGIERVDLSNGEAQGFFITEAELGGDINDFVLISDRLGYAVVSKPDFTNDVVTFDPTDGTATGTVLSGVEFISDIELNDRGELYMADRTSARPGIRIFRAADGTELTPQPLDLGLPPFEIVFLR